MLLPFSIHDTLVNLCLHHKFILDRRCQFSSQIHVICGKFWFSAFITCWRLVPNARRIGRIIGSDSTSHFETPQSHENGSEASKLGSVRVEAERRRFCTMSAVGPMLQNQWKPTLKRWHGRSYPTCRTLPISISISTFIKKSKNRSIRGSPQKTHRFFKMVADNCQKDGKK